MRPPDAAFADPRQAALYDVFDDDRRDLDAYVAIAREVEAVRVVDVGCGTGCLALLLAGQGLEVVGVDPAAAPIDIARAKPGADRVTWIVGDATALPSEPPADLLVMTGNVAQVFVSDEDWHATLAAAARVVRPEGWLVFETRRPEARAWEDWELAPTTVALPDGREAICSRTVIGVNLPLVTFEGTTLIGDEVLHSRSTLRFRDAEEIAADLLEHGFSVVEVREAPDRPGKELVFLARRGGTETTRL